MIDEYTCHILKTFAKYKATTELKIQYFRKSNTKFRICAQSNYQLFLEKIIDLQENYSTGTYYP